MIPDRKPSGSARILRDLIEAVVLSALLFLLLQFALQNTIVEGNSMEPNFVDRQWLLVSKIAYRLGEPGRGDVIVFHSPEDPGKDFIKRVIGLPGETVTIRDGKVRIDGEALNEVWEPYGDDSSFGPYEVPAGDYFVLGDNRARSNDSRTWQGAGAALDGSRIVGKAWLSVWPREAWGVVRSDQHGPARGIAPQARSER
jgi:signal peptidase I